MGDLKLVEGFIIVDYTGKSYYATIADKMCDCLELAKQSIDGFLKHRASDKRVCFIKRTIIITFPIVEVEEQILSVTNAYSELIKQLVKQNNEG